MSWGGFPPIVAFDIVCGKVLPAVGGMTENMVQRQQPAAAVRFEGRCKMGASRARPEGLAGPVLPVPWLVASSSCEYSRRQPAAVEYLRNVRRQLFKSLHQFITLFSLTVHSAVPELFA